MGVYILNCSLRDSILLFSLNCSAMVSEPKGLFPLYATVKTLLPRQQAQAGKIPAALCGQAQTHPP
jgi:hypothetical protein